MKPNPSIFPGGAYYTTRDSQVIVQEVRPVGMGYQVRGIERWPDVLRSEQPIRMAQEDFIVLTRGV